MRKENIFWGLILVLLGGLLLMDNLGLLPRGVNVWTLFWPLVLIGLGVNGILRAVSPRSGGAHGPVVVGSSSAGASSSDRDVQTLRLPLEGEQSATVRFHHGAGELRVDDRAAPGELLNGSFAGGVEQQVSRGVDQSVIDLRVPPGSFGPMMPFDSRPLNWTVGLNPEVPLNLEMEVGASRNRLDFSNLQLKDLRLQTGASETDITFPQRAGQTNAVIRSGAASVNIRIPDNVSASIRARGGLASVEVDTTRFPQSGGMYRSPDYEVSANRVELDIETGVGAVTVR